MTQPSLHWLAAAVNPLMVLIFAARTVSMLPSRERVLDLLFRCGAALLITFLLAHLNRWTLLWKAHLNFPSGHMTFYLTVATFLFLLDRRSALFTLPLALLYGWLIVFLHFHCWLDLWGALILAVPVSLLCAGKTAARSRMAP